MYRLLLLLLALVIPVTASAGVPDPRNSTVPFCWTLCPNGDLSVTLTIRDVSNAPLNNVNVWIDLCSCSSVHLCPASANDGYTLIGCEAHKLTNAAGQATFALRGGGGCTTGAVVRADGVEMQNVITIASPDQDGSLTVDAADVALLIAKHGGADRTGDITCNGAVDADDDAAQQPHMGHACTNQTPALPTSWGSVRALYR